LPDFISRSQIYWKILRFFCFRNSCIAKNELNLVDGSPPKKRKITGWMNLLSPRFFFLFQISAVATIKKI
jgi:hypothetical protein